MLVLVYRVLAQNVLKVWESRNNQVSNTFVYLSLCEVYVSLSFLIAAIIFNKYTHK